MFRPITINAVLNGWIVTVGCQTVVYQDRNQLVTDLDAYMRDPDATEARFLHTSVNQGHTSGGGMPATLGGAYGSVTNEAPLSTSAPLSRDQLRQLIRAQEAQANAEQMAKSAVARERG
jgi:hypothetical protein